MSSTTYPANVTEGILPSFEKRFAFEYLPLALVVAADLLFVTMRLWGMTQYPLDGDEIFSLQAARQSYSGLLTTAARDISHPPLFYLLLKLWIAVGGQSLLWLRMLPVTLSIASLVPIHLLGRRFQLRPHEQALAIALLAGNSFLLFYTQYLRMFVLLEFFSAWSLWAFARLVTQPKLSRMEWLGVWLVNVGLVYSHYWGWVVLGAEFLALLLVARDKVLPVLGVGIGLVAAYLPWIAAIVRVVTTTGTATQQISWITKPRWQDAVWFYASLNGTFDVPRSTIPGLILFGLPVLLLLIRLMRRPYKQSHGDSVLVTTMLALATIPVAVTFLLSHVMKQSVWAERQLMMVALPYAILVAVAACRLKNRWARVGVPLLIAAWTITAAYIDKGDVQKLAWDKLVAGMKAVEPHATSPTIAYASEGFIAVPLAFHANDGRTAWLDVHVDPALERLPQQRCWVVYRDRTWTETETPQAKLLAAHYHIDNHVSISDQGQTITALLVWK